MRSLPRAELWILTVPLPSPVLLCEFLTKILKFSLKINFHILKGLCFSLKPLLRLAALMSPAGFGGVCSSFGIFAQPWNPNCSSQHRGTTSLLSPGPGNGITFLQEPFHTEQNLLWFSVSEFEHWDKFSFFFLLIRGDLFTVFLKFSFVSNS